MFIRVSALLHKCEFNYSPPETPERPIREEVTPNPLTAEIAMATTRRNEKERMVSRRMRPVVLFTS
jgi:hypothetical protein